MLIYSVADIHAKPDRMDRVASNVDRFKPDVLVVAGDLTSWSNQDPVIAFLSDLPLPVLAVRGNSDRRNVERLLQDFPGVFSLHLREEKLGDASFVGVSGAVPVPFWTRLAWREAGLLDQLAEMVRPDSILVAHPPPRGAQDEVLGLFHAGSSGLARLIRQSKPAMLLCGHIHERGGVVSVGPTLVINSSLSRTRNGALVEYVAGGGTRVEILSG